MMAFLDSESVMLLLGPEEDWGTENVSITSEEAIELLESSKEEEEDKEEEGKTGSSSSQVRSPDDGGAAATDVPLTVVDVEGDASLQIGPNLQVGKASLMEPTRKSFKCELCDEMISKDGNSLKAHFAAYGLTPYEYFAVFEPPEDEGGNVLRKIVEEEASDANRVEEPSAVDEMFKRPRIKRPSPMNETKVRILTKLKEVVRPKPVERNNNVERKFLGKKEAMTLTRAWLEDVTGPKEISCQACGKRIMKRRMVLERHFRVNHGIDLWEYYMRFLAGHLDEGELDRESKSNEDSTLQRTTSY